MRMLCVILAGIVLSTSSGLMVSAHHCNKLNKAGLTILGFGMNCESALDEAGEECNAWDNAENGKCCDSITGFAKLDTPQELPTAIQIAIDDTIYSAQLIEYHHTYKSCVLQQQGYQPPLLFRNLQQEFQVYLC